MFTRQFITHAKMNFCMKLLRTLHNKPQSVNEASAVEIPVPWGKVSGKLWGSQNKQPILAMHGWQDNAASFDNLAPLITKNTPVLSIDLPGHGLSSWLPPGFLYTEIVYLLLIKRIKRYFGWEKVKILAHSLSSMTTYWYAATFPMDLQYVVTLDFYKFPSIDVNMYLPKLSETTDALFKLEESNSAPPKYSENEITKKWFGGYMQLDEASGRILMSRGITQKEDGMYIFNRDPRIRIMPVHSMFSKKQLEQFAEYIKCPYLILRGQDSFYVDTEEEYHNTLKIMKMNNKNIYFEEVPGGHHFHLTHAEQAAAIINPFLEKFD